MGGGGGGQKVSVLGFSHFVAHPSLELMTGPLLCFSVPYLYTFPYFLLKTWWMLYGPCRRKYMKGIDLALDLPSVVWIDNLERRWSQEMSILIKPCRGGPGHDVFML